MFMRLFGEKNRLYSFSIEKNGNAIGNELHDTADQYAADNQSFCM
jgi:hypothetical protein